MKISTIRTAALSLITCNPSLFASTATPSLNNHCSYSLKTPLNGTGVTFDESCNIAYVHPPKLGTAELGALAPSANLQFCGMVNSVGETADRTTSTMKTLSDKVGTMIEGFQPLEQEILEAEDGLVVAKATMESTKRKLEAAEDKLSLMREDIRIAKKSYEDCIEDYSESTPSCLDFKALLEKSREIVAKFRATEHRKILDKLDDDQLEIDIRSGRLKVYKNRYLDAIAPMVELQERIASLTLKVMELYREYSKLEGATGIIHWSVPWDTLLRDYQISNSALPLQWAQLPIKEAFLIGSIKSASDTSDGVSSILSARILGLKPAGLAGMGTGQKAAEAQTIPSSPTEASLAFSNSMSGQVILTLAGACPYATVMDNGNFRDISGITSHILANLAYTYELATRRSYTAHYNLSELLKKIEEKTKRGGFFITSVTHSILNESNARDWFSIKFDANSSEFNYSPAEQAEITQAVKQELMDRAFKEFAILHAGQPSPPPLPNFAESGASRSVKELRKCLHLYCQAASAIIGVSQSIWGKNFAVANFHHNNNVWTTEHVTGIQFVQRAGSLAFKAEQQ